MRAKRLVLSRWWNHLPLLLCFASTLWLLRPSAFSQPSGAPLAACQTPTVVSLATTAKRLADGRLQTTLRSLLRQALPCAPRIWLWVPDTDRQAAEAAVPHLQRLVAGVWRRQRGGPPPPAAVVLRLVPDAGPASKFLHAVAALSWPDGTWQSPPPGSVFALGGGAAGAAGTSAQEQQAQWRAAADDRAALAGAADAHLFVVDDDQYYAPDALPTLLSWRGRLRRAVLSCRGWRVREDGAWGVPPGEFDRHVVEGWRLAEPYQVGVGSRLLSRGWDGSGHAGENVGQCRISAARLAGCVCHL